MDILETLTGLWTRVILGIMILILSILVRFLLKKSAYPYMLIFMKVVNILVIIMESYFKLRLKFRDTDVTDTSSTLSNFMTIVLFAFGVPAIFNGYKTYKDKMGKSI